MNEGEEDDIEAVGILVVRTVDPGPEGLGSMPVPPNTLRVHTEYVLVLNQWVRTSGGLNHECRELEKISLRFSSIVEGGDRWWRHLPSLQEFYRAKSYCHLYGAQG
ncbi:hypothetical protein TNCV_1782561 [Trichonephila clavipes]|nr:hypothetical protein TNCV_1782561 [Trichonephila clavipes]